MTGSLDATARLFVVHGVTTPCHLSAHLVQLTLHCHTCTAAIYVVLSCLRAAKLVSLPHLCPCVQEVQLERTMLNIRSKESALEKYIYLQGLQVWERRQ